MRRAVLPKEYPGSPGKSCAVCGSRRCAEDDLAPLVDEAGFAELEGLGTVGLFKSSHSCGKGQRESMAGFGLPSSTSMEIKWSNDSCQ